MFKFWDANTDGMLSVQELHDCLKQAGEDVPIGEIEQAFNEIGATNGKIDLDTFKKAMAEQPPQ